MAEEKKHHLFHRHKDEDKPAEEVGAVYSDTSFGGDGGSYGGGEYYSQTTGAVAGAYDTGAGAYDTGAGEYEKHRKEEKEHKRKEHVGEMGALAAGAFALYEKHEAKKDPENAHRHKIEEEVAGAVAVGSGGYAFHEKHERKDAKKEAEEEAAGMNARALI